MIKFVRFFDPRFDKYRDLPFSALAEHYQSSAEPTLTDEETSAPEPELVPEPEPEPYTPASTRELVELLARTPETVLSRRQRNTLAGLMTFDDIPVESIMTPKDEMTFLKDSDFLGPLVVDRLYKTGQIHFPVQDHKQKICGILRTAQLDPLGISEDEPITKFLNYNLCYVRKDYSLEMTLAAMLRTGSDYALVVDRNSDLVGSLTLEVVIIMLFSRRVADHFDADCDPSAVAERAEK